MKYIAFVLFLALVGCGTQDVKPNDPVIVPATQTVNLPPEQVSECADLPAPDLKALTQGETLALLSLWFNTYLPCRLNHNALVKTVRKAFNIGDQPVTATITVPVNNVSNKPNN